MNWFSILFGGHKKNLSFTRLFGKYVSPEQVDELTRAAIKGARLPATWRHEVPVSFVIAAVRGNGSEEIGYRLGQLGDLAVACGALVQSIVSNIMVVAFDRMNEGEAAAAAAALANDFHSAYPNDAKVIYGDGIGSVGTAQGQLVLRYTFVLNGFDNALSLLAETQYGAVRKST
jgi:hypothetical protein